MPDLIGEEFALLLWSTDDSGEEDVSLFNGTLRKSDSGYFVDRGPHKESFEILPEWIERIKVVPDDLAETLRGAKAQLSLSVGMLDSSSDTSDYLHTGLKWPKDDN